MDEKRKINLQQHQLKKGKKWYLIKISFYILVLLGVLGYMWYKVRSTDPNQHLKELNIDGIELDITQ